MFPMQIYPRGRGKLLILPGNPFLKNLSPSRKKGKKVGEKRGNETILQNSQENNIVSIQEHLQRKSTIK